MPYKQARRLFGTRFDFFVFFEDKEGCLIEVDGSYGIGHSGVEIASEGGPLSCTLGTEGLTVDMGTINPAKLVKIARFAVYDSAIIKMVVYIWQ